MTLLLNTRRSGNYFPVFNSLQQFCESYDSDTTELRINLDSHTLFKYRVNVVLSNFKPFADTFNCPIGSPMNPEAKCAVW